MPYKVFANLNYLDETDLNNYLMKQTVMTFASATARDAALTAPSAGMMAFTSDTATLWIFATTWKKVLYGQQSWLAGKSSVTTDASGIGTIAHNFGSIPNSAIVTPELGAGSVLMTPYDRPNWTATTIKIRAFVTSTGGASVGTFSSVD